MQPLTKQAIREILQARLEGDSFTSLKTLPHPHTLKDAQKGARIVQEAMEKNQKILLVGDYDADGTLGVVICMSFFARIGYENISYYIPNRFKDGYGVQPHIIEQNPCDLVITIDNGIVAFDVGEYCAKHGKTLIITDHHQLQDALPQADAIINPQQGDCGFPQKEICGAAVAWYFCNAIKITLGLQTPMQDLLKYVAIATIADMMPLTHVNKLFVKHGLESFKASQDTSNMLLKTLLSSPKFRAQDVGFSITPLLNSAGRMADASLICKYFLSEDKEQCKKIFQELKALNATRKELVRSMLDGEKQILENDSCIIAYQEGWSEGVLGILAANLTDAHQKPAFALSAKDGVLKGSGRSDGVVDIFQLLLPHQGEFVRFGGHSEAVGITLSEEKLPRLLEIFSTQDKPLVEQKDEAVLGTLELGDIDKGLLALLNEFEPYGQGNPSPLFLLKNARIKSARILKDLHQRLELGSGLHAMEFFAKEFYEKDERVDICFSLQEERFDAGLTLLAKSLCRS